MQTVGGSTAHAANAASKCCTNTRPTSRVTHSSKMAIRKRPHCSAVTERSVTVFPSWKPVSLFRSTIGINWMNCAPTWSRKNRYTSAGCVTLAALTAHIMCAVSAANVTHPAEVYRFLRDHVGAQFIQFIPIVERNNETGFQEGNTVTDRSVTAEQWGRFLIAIFDEWVTRDVGRVFVQHFDAALAAWAVEPPTVCIFSPTCGTALTLEHNGDLYSCDHFVEPNYLLGNILDTPLIELVSSDAQRQFGLNKRDALPRYCQECPALFACHGECPKNRFKETPTGELGLNYLCAGYRAFFTHIDQPMRQMTALVQQGRAPAEVMSKHRRPTCLLY